MFVNAREWHRLLLLRRVKRFIRFLFSFQIKSFVLNSIYTFSLLNVTNKIDFMKTFLVIISKFDYPYITIGITAAYNVVPFKRHWIKRKSLDLFRWGFKLKSTNLFGYFKDNCCKQYCIYVLWNRFKHFVNWNCMYWSFPVCETVSLSIMWSAKIIILNAIKENHTLYPVNLIWGCLR